LTAFEEKQVRIPTLPIMFRIPRFRTAREASQFGVPLVVKAVYWFAL